MTWWSDCFECCLKWIVHNLENFEYQSIRKLPFLFINLFHLGKKMWCVFLLILSLFKYIFCFLTECVCTLKIRCRLNTLHFYIEWKLSEPLQFRYMHFLVRHNICIATHLFRALQQLGKAMEWRVVVQSHHFCASHGIASGCIDFPVPLCSM